MNLTDQVNSIVVPLHNDAEYVADFVRELLAAVRLESALYEIILVDDGSQDATAAIVDELLRVSPGVRLLRLSRRFGPDIAVMAGLSAAVGDVVVVMRPASDPPAILHTVLEQVRKGGDICLGVAENPPPNPLLFRFCRSAFAFVWRRLIGGDLPSAHCSLFGLTRRAVNAITRIKQHQPQMSLLSCSVGFQKCEFRYRKVYRSSHGPSLSLLQNIDLGLELIVSNTRSPLRWVSGLGFAAASLNLLYVGYIVMVNLVKDHVAEGWTTLSLQNSLMFLLVFLTLGLLAEYVSRTQRESERGPLFHILEEKGSSVVTSDPALRNVVTDERPAPWEVRRAA